MSDVSGKPDRVPPAGNLGPPDLQGWTPLCPQPDEILALATGARQPDAVRVAEHVLACPFCLEAYAQTRAALGKSSAVEEPAPMPRESRWTRAAVPAFGFALGAAAAVVALWFAAVNPVRTDEARLRAALTAEREARTRQAAADARTIADLRSRAVLRPPVRIVDSGDAAALEAAILSRKLEIPDGIRALAQTVRSAQSEGAELRLKQPVETFVLRAGLVLEAAPAADVSDVRVSVTDSAGLDVPVTRISPFAWKVSSPLRVGETYHWSVEGSRGGERVLSPVSAFQVVDAHTESAVLSAQARNRDHPLVLAVLYARAGLLDDAESALSQVLKAHPQHSVAAFLLADLRRTRSEQR